MSLLDLLHTIIIRLLYEQIVPNRIIILKLRT